MKKHMYICLLVSLIMILLCSQTAFAEFKNTEFINGGIQYFYYPETKSMEIYQTHSGHGGTYLYAESPFKNCGVETATIGDGVLKIGHNLFRDCKTLKSVTIGNDTTYLNQTVFKGCTALKDVTLGNGLTEFVYATFQNCRSLTSISLPDSLIKMGSYDLADCTSLRTVKLSKNLTIIPHGLCENDTSLTKVTLPDKLEVIKNQAFYHCSKLTGNIVLPSTLKEICSYAFGDCTSLKSITVPNSVETVGQYAFNNITDRIYLDCLPGYKLMDDTSYSNAGNPKYLKDMKIAEVDDINYTGGAVEPKISVSIVNQMNGETVKQLTEGKDYTVTYLNNNKAGTATADITYIGDYADYDGDVNSIDFEIKGKSAEQLTINPIPDQVYIGMPIMPIPDIWELK